MKHFFKACTATAAVAVMGLASLSARAETVPLNYITAVFSGNCIDCAAAAGTPSYNVTATLVLRDVLPEPYQTKVMPRNFVSFSYGGSNLFAPYVITETDVTYFSGVWNIGSAYFSIGKNLGDGTALFFKYVFASCPTTDDSGNCILDFNGPWSTGIGANIDDYGDRGTWQVVSVDNNVPEPAIPLLLGAALAGLGLTRRRQN